MIRKLLQILLFTLTLTLSLSPVFATISTVDSQGGAYSSIKLQSDGKPAVAYFDHKTGELRYSYWTANGTVNQWIRTVVEEKGVTGYVSLWLGSGNKPYISYYHNISKNNSTGSDINGKYGNHMVGALKYAYCSTTTCLTPEDWTKVTVAEIGQSQNGHTGGFTSLAFDSSGNPRIAYYDFSHKIDANDIKKGALKLAYCDSNCSSSSSWSISTVDTDGGRSASMVINSSNKVMFSYDADEVQTVRYAEGSPPFSSWTKADIDTIVNTSNLFRDTSIAIHPTTGKPRLIYQYQGQADYGTGGTCSSCTRSVSDRYYGYNTPGIITRRDAYYAYCDAADCTVSTNWTKNVVLESNERYLRGYTSSIKVGSDGPKIAYHYWGHRANSAYSIGLTQNLQYVNCTTANCSSKNISTIDSTENTGLYSSIALDSSNNPLISYYDYDSNQLKLYHPTNSYTDAGITADTRASDTSNGGTGLQSGDSFKILFSGATNGAACSITTANIDSILKLSNGHSWVCSGSSITATWSNTYNTNDTLTITVTSGTGGCVPTVEVGDRVSLNGTCILDGSGNPIILQTEIRGSTGVKVPTGAVAYWKMDEGAKLTAWDSVGPHNASLNNGVTWTTGLSGSGLSLDGSDDYLIVPGNPVDLDIKGGKITIEAWLKPNNLFSTNYTVLSKENSYAMTSNGQCAIETSDTGTTWAWYGGASMSRLQRNYSGNKDIWRQVVCTYDGTTQKVYIDGIFDGSLSRTGTVSASNYPFVMGRRELSTWPTNRGYDSNGCPGTVSGCSGENYWGTNYYNGKMDEVVIYNTALSQTEILNRFSSLPAQFERADANDTSMSGYGLQAGDTIAIRFTNETNAPTINAGNINTVLSVTGKTWKDGSGNIGSAVWSQTRFTNDTLLITLSTATSAPTVATGDIITLSGGIIKEKTGINSITGSTKIRGSYDLNGAVAYWNLDESSGDPSDSVGQYNTGTLACVGTGCTNPTYAAGKYGNAMTFASASSQYVSVSNYPDLNPSTSITVEAWVSLSDTGAEHVILSKNNQYLLRYSTNNKFSFYLYDGTDWEPGVHSATLPSSNTWYHVVGTWDGTNQKIYVNGVLENTVTHNFTSASTTNAVEIGKWSAYMNGLIDEVVIYNRAITDDEVRKRNSSRLKTAVAKDASGLSGIQAGDKVIITFDAPTGATSITSANIGTALSLSSSHSWKDGAGNIGSAVWSTTTYTNDTLTITLSTGTSVPTVAVGDTITLGTTIKDTFNRTITGSLTIGGTFGTALPSGSVAYYNFDEQSGGTAHDSIGNNHGTLNNSFWKTERLFKGLYFDGSRYVDVPDSSDFDLSSYTIDAWVKVPDGLTTTTQYRQIISQDDGANYWRMRLNNNTLELCDSRLTMSDSTTCFKTATTINDGEWHHVAVVRDGTNNQVLLYIDGVPLATDNTTGGGTAHNISAAVQLGRKYDSTGYFYGMIDEVVLYNRALTATDIQSRYRAPLKSAFTSDIYFNSGKQAGDKVIIRFHGKTNGSTPAIDATNINTILQLSSGSWKDGANQIGSAVWSTYKWTNDTLTITLSAGTSAPTIASGATITVNGTYIKDTFNNAISDSITLSKDFDFNLPEGAVAYYKMENNNDSFGTNNITTNTGTGGACKFGNCYTYGANQYASITNSYTLNPERITVEAWVNPGTSTATWATGNAYFFYGANSVQFYGAAGAATVRFSVYVNGAWTNMNYTPSSISGWHHYVGTYDGANLRLYMDGVAVGTPVTLSGVINQFDTGTFYLTQPATANNPSVSIDDVAVYNRALTAEEVLGRYGDYTVTAIARDTSGGGPGIQAGDTVTFKFSGPTNGAVIDAANIDNALAIYELNTWKDGSGNIGSAVWSSPTYSNDTLTITLSTGTSVPTVAPLNNITIGSPIGSKYRAFTKSAKIGGLFGDNLPASGNKVVYYNFNEQNGTTAYDSIGSNHGTLNNSFWRTEQTFKGLYFDGSRYVDIPDSDDFNLSSYTIDAWVKVPDGLTTGIRQIISQDNGTSYWRMRLNNNTLELCDSRLTSPCNNTATTINDGEWHHIAVVRDDALDKVLFYIDGVNIWTVSSLTETGTHAINANIQIGRKYNGTEYFYGMIDEVVLYNRVLTDAEIQTRYRAPVKSAFTSDSYFSSGIVSGKDKVVIRFHGKTNVATAIDSTNINTILPITGKTTGWGTVQGAVWSTYPTGGTMTNNTLTITLGTGATIAKGDTITTNGTYIKDLYLNSISDLITLSGDFNLNLPEGAGAYWRFDETTGTTASDSFNGNSGTLINSTWTTGKINNALQFGGPLTYTKLSAGTATAISTSANYRLNGPQDGQGSTVGTCTSTTSTCYTWRANTAVNNEWWQVNFGSSQTISRVKVYAYTTGTTATYKVQTSPDGSTWTDRGSTTTNGWTTFDFSPITSQYVRVYETANAGDGFLYISEVEVYNDNSGNNYAQVNNSYSLNPERLTVEAWAKSGAASWNVTDALVTKASAYKLSTTSGSKNMSFYIYAGGAWRGPATFTADGSFDITQWHHYAGTYDGANLKIYVDGVLKNTTAYTGVINITDTTGLYIGSDNGTTNYLNANIDEVAIYNRALTLEEVIGRYGDYSPITAFANDPAPDVSGIQAGDTVEIRFPGPTNGAFIDASNIDNFLTLSNTHSWKDGSLAIGSAVWSTRVYENDTLTITLSATTSAPTVAPQDTISIGGAGEINAKYRAAAWNPKISGTFGEPLPGTPAAFWKMDENTGNIAFDTVGTNDGTLSGTTIPAWGTGFFNYGLDFNSSTAYMNVGSIILIGDWSIEGWFKYPLPIVTGTYNSLTGDRRVVVQRTTMKLGTYNGAFVDLDTPYLMSGLVSGWHHIAAVGDSTVGGCSPLPDGCTKFYIDSVLVGTANYKTTAALTTIGNTTAGNEQFGLIDELAVYSSALTADEVASRYLVFFKEIYAKDTSNGGANVQNGDQVIVRFDGPTGATFIDGNNIANALQLSAGSWGTITSANWSTTYKTNDTLTITLQTSATITTSPRITITLGTIIKDAYGKDITGSMQIGGDFGTNLPDGAVGYWKFDDGTSGSTPATAYDSFNDNNGTLTNTPTWTTAGRFNNALSFTGGTTTDADYVVVSNATVLNPGKLTVEAWAKSGVASWNVTDALVTKSSAYKLSTTSGSKTVSFSVYAGGAWRSVSYTPSSISEWHHYAGTYDGTNIKIYVDGSLKNTTAYTGSVNTTDTGNLFIGYNGGSAYLSADIDEVVLYNRALDAAEIRTRYGAGFASAVADDNSNKGPNIQANDRVIITFTGATNGPTINAGNINTILPVTSNHSWLDGVLNLGTPAPTWSQTTYPNDTLTITLSGPATYTATSPTKPAVVVGDTITINGTITDSSSRVIRDNVAITGDFGVSSTATMSSALASDSSGKGPNIQAGDRVVITFAGATNTPAIDATNINTILPLNNGHSWRDSSGNIGGAVWTTNAILTITLSGSANYVNPDTLKPTVVAGDTITIDGTITDSTGKAIISSRAITGDFGVSSTATMSSALASDSSGKGPNIQSGDRVVIKFNGSTIAPVIDATNINTILPLPLIGLYRKPITITGSTAGVQTNYQVLVTVDTQSLITAGKMQSTGADIRFTNASGTLLSYWIESGINTTSTRIWVKVDSIPASPSTATIYMYYGNSTASAVSNGDNVFEFFDDFTGTTINTAKWIETDSASNYITQNGQITIANGTGAWTTTGMFTQNNFARGNKEVWYKFKPVCTTGTTYRVTTMLGWKDTTAGVNYTGMPHAFYWYRTTTANTESFQVYENGTSRGDVAAGSPDFTCGTQYWGKVALKSTGADYYTSTDGTNWTLRYTGTALTTTPLKVGFTHYQGGTNYLDDVFIRQYASSEPSVGAPGTEESGTKTWLDGNGVLGGTGTAVWSQTTNLNDTLTITLSGSANYVNPDTLKPTVVVGDTITIDGTITDPSGKAIISSIVIGGSFGTASSVIPNTAVANDTSNWGPNIQANDTVTITFSGATNAPTIDATNIDTVLLVSGKTWKDGNGAIGGAVWNTSSQLIITLAGPATQQLATPTRSNIVVGDTIVIDGTITDTSSGLIIAGISITNSFGTTSGTVISSANAFDDNGKYGINAGDKVTITFNGQIGRTGDTPPTINAGNINTVLAVSGKTWLDGAGALGGTGEGVWTTDVYQNDTLTITLSNTTSAPTVAVGDTITLGGGVITDKYRTAISSSLAITGDFGKPLSAKAEWKFESNGNDSISGSYNGTVTGTYPTGRFSNGVLFDASGEYNNITQYTLTSNWTIEGWFKWPLTVPVSGQQKNTLISSNSTSNENQIIIENSTKYLGTSYGNNYYYVPNYNLSNLTTGWHHVAAVGTGGSGTGGTTQFYIDGVSVGTASYKSESNIKYLGNSYDGNRPMGNTIDNIVVYNTTLDAATIMNRYGSWPRSAFAYGTAGDYAGITTGDQVVINFDRATEGNTINSSNIATALVLSSSHTWGTIQSAVWSTTTYTNDTLTITLTTTGSPTIAKGDTITLSNNVLKDHAGRPISDSVTLQGSFDFKLPLGAIAYWRFNEGSGTPVNDSWGSNNGTVTGTNVWADAMYGTKGLTIDAADEAVALTTALNMPTEWTIIGWIKTPVSGTGDHALTHSSSDHEHAININAGAANHELGNISPTTDPGGSQFRGSGYYVNKQLKNGWHQIAAVGTGGSGTAGTTTYYIDGQPVGSAVGYKAYTAIGSIGNNTGAGLHAIGTTIDEISIYDRPLTVTEIRQYYGARLKYARAKDTQSLNKFGIDAGDQVVLRFDGETSVTTPITAANIDTVLALNNGHTWKDGNGAIGSAVWSTVTYTNDTLTITLSTGLLPPTITTRDTITLDGVTIKDLNRVITGSIDISGDFDGSVAYYDLDEGSAVTAEDGVNGNNGTLGGQSSTLPTWVSGYSGSALDFNDANTQYVTIPDSSSFNLTDYTIEAWIKLPATIPSGNYMRIVSQESNTNPTNYWSLAINPSGQLVHCDSLSSFTAPVGITVANSTTTSGSATVLTTNNFSTAGVKAGLAVTGTGIDVDTYVKQVNSGTQITLSKNATASGTVTLTFTTSYDMGGLPNGQYPKCETVDTKDLRDDKWHFVSVVRDTNANQFKFFIDHGNCTPGCSPDKTVTNSAGSSTHTIAGTVEIGRKNGYTGNPTSSEYFRGLIDNVAIYNYAMTDAEVNIHHFLYPSEAWASNTSGSGTSGIQAGDSVTILFNGETGATAISNLTTLNSALKLPTTGGKTWGTTFGSAVWSQSYYPNDTLKVTLGSGAIMAIGDTITLGNVILDVHSNPISGSIAITGSFDVNVPIGAIAYWDFNEGVNSSIADKVGSYSGSLNATPTTEWVTGKFSYGLDFSGTLNYVNLPTYVPLSSNEWTIEAWFYAPLATNSDNNNVLIMYDNATAQIAVMPVSGTRYLGTYYSGAGGGFYSSGYNVASLTTGWHHLAAVGMNNQTKFYIDGTLVGTSGYQSKISIRRVGNGYDASATFKRPFGKVDDVVIYKRALSTTEISQRAAR
ncbi:MAG: DUF2341 domain-containing protein [Nitrospinae bacterium]|nr:DUF2341 domain-containing protein [Nitrospinota bacterium]